MAGATLSFSRNLPKRLPLLFDFCKQDLCLFFYKLRDRCKLFYVAINGMSLMPLDRLPLILNPELVFKRLNRVCSDSTLSFNTGAKWMLTWPCASVWSSSPAYIKFWQKTPARWTAYANDLSSIRTTQCIGHQTAGCASTLPIQPWLPWQREKQTERESMAYLAQGSYRMPAPVPACQGTGVSGMCVLPSGGRRDASHALPLPAVGMNSTLPA